MELAKAGDRFHTVAQERSWSQQTQISILLHFLNCCSTHTTDETIDERMHGFLKDIESFEDEQ